MNAQSLFIFCWSQSQKSLILYCFNPKIVCQLFPANQKKVLKTLFVISFSQKSTWTLKTPPFREFTAFERKKTFVRGGVGTKFLIPRGQFWGGGRKIPVLDRGGGIDPNTDYAFIPWPQWLNLFLWSKIWILAILTIIKMAIKWRGRPCDEELNQFSTSGSDLVLSIFDL